MNVYENRGQLGSPADRTNRVRQDNTGSMALMREKQKTWDIGMKFLLGEQERREAVDAMSLNGEYSNRMAELQTKLMTNKEGAARDNVRLLDEGRQKIIDEISANGKDRYSLQTINAFKGMCDKDYVKTRSNMVKYVTGENEKFESNTLLQQKTVMVNDFASEFESDDALGNALERGRAVIAAGLNGYGEARVNDEFGKYRADLIEAGVNAALNAKNFERADDLLVAGKDFLSAEKASKLQKDMDERVLTSKTADGARRLFMETEGNYSVMLDRFKKEVLSTDRAERVKQLEMFDKEYESLKKQARQAADTNYERTVAGVRALVNGGMDYGDILAEIDRLSGGDVARKGKLLGELNRQMGKGGAGIDDAGNKKALWLVTAGKFRNKEELAEFLADENACVQVLGGVPTKQQVKVLLAEYSDFNNGNGVYKVDWKGIMTNVMASQAMQDSIKAMGIKGNSKDKHVVAMVKETVEGVGKEFVQAYLRGEVKGRDGKTHIGELPSRREILDVCSKAAARVDYGKYRDVWLPFDWGDRSLEMSPADMWRLNIKKVTALDNGKYKVEYRDDYDPEVFDGEDLQEMVGGLWK